MRKILIGALCGMNMQVSYASVGAEDFSGTILLLLVIVFVVMAVILFVAKESKKTNENKEGEFELEIKKVIPEFEEEDFLAWVTTRFIKFQKSWTKQAIEELHPFETDSLFEMHKMQLAELKNKKISNIIEGTSVKETEIVGFSNNETTYDIVVRIRATMRNYFIQENVSAAQENALRSYNYYLMFEKQKDNKKLSNCPACTAPVVTNINYCEYCHTTFPEAMDQWLLAKVDVV